MTLYLDASALIPTIVPEATSGIIDAFLLSQSSRMVVGDFAVAEVASALSRLTRAGAIARADAKAALQAFDEWRTIVAYPLDLQAADARLAGEYVRRFDLMLRAPDAIHIAICRRLGLTLVTLDRRMAVAAQALDVAVTVPA